MKKPIKIAFVIDTIETPAAGTERQLLLLLNNLDKTRFEPYLICLRNSSWLKEQNFFFPVIILNLKSLFSLKFISSLFKFRRLYKEKRFDIIQTFFKDTNVFGTVAAKFAGCPVIISSRRNIGYWHSKFDIKILRFLRRWTSHYLANSNTAKEQTVMVEKVSSEKIKVIYNALDLEKFKDINPALRTKQRQLWKIEDNEILIGSIANLRKVKNIDAIITAATKLCQNFSNLKFVVIGEGEEREHLQKLIKMNSLTEKFLLPGRYENIIPCLAAFDIAVLVSSSESFSNVLIEYMAAGLPIVASDVGGNSEAIVDNESGLLYRLANPDELVKSVTRIINDRELTDKLKTNARKRAWENYRKEEIIQQYEDYYSALVKG